MQLVEQPGAGGAGAAGGVGGDGGDKGTFGTGGSWWRRFTGGDAGDGRWYDYCAQLPANVHFGPRSNRRPISNHTVNNQNQNWVINTQFFLYF